MEQLSLQFNYNVNFDVENYIVTDSNREAFNWVTQWPLWENHMSCVFGEKGSGKTYLTKIWQNFSKAVLITQELLSEQSYFESESDCYILEDLEGFTECPKDLFGFLNHVIHTKTFLLATSEVHPMKIDFKLPDLQSRLNSIFAISIKKPNEEMIRHILVKYFSDRHIVVERNVITYLTHHVDRSYSGVANIVYHLDKYALINHRKISISLVKEVCSFINKASSNF